MPELPEVETLRRGLEPLAVGRRFRGARVRQSRLRKRITPGLDGKVAGAKLEALERRAKYLLFRFSSGTLLLHLGMSGTLFRSHAGTPPGKHDHFDLLLPGKEILRYRDPRRFGMAVWTSAPPLSHPLLAHLGPEPLGPGLNAAYLREVFHNRKAPVKSLLMDGRNVAGIGNIYACEALYRAGISPVRAGGRISASRCGFLVEGIQSVLGEALEAGGTTLRDHRQVDGSPGWFSQNLAVYGRKGQECPACGETVKKRVLSGRATFWCPHCQR